MATAARTTEAVAYPMHVFRFHVAFMEHRLAQQAGQGVELCSGAFAECTGLEATMEPKVIKEGGRNYGAIQRAGPVTFATVVLKRGITRSRDLWQWFAMASSRSLYAYRLDATLTMFDAAGDGVLAWKLANALPIKFKAADFNARATEVGIEELHLAHEGLSVDVNPQAQLLSAELGAGRRNG